MRTAPETNLEVVVDGAAVMKRVSSHQVLMNELSTQSIRRETPQKLLKEWFFLIRDLIITNLIRKSRFGAISGGKLIN